jgi:hypothetical protein
VGARGLTAFKRYSDGFRLGRFGYSLHWSWTRGLVFGAEWLPFEGRWDRSRTLSRVEIRLGIAKVSIAHRQTWAEGH